MSIIRKLNNENLLKAQDLLKESRKALINSYTEKDSERYHYSFQYYKYKETLKIVSDLLDHKWIDYHINQIMELYNSKEISIDCFQLSLWFFKKYLYRNSNKQILSESLIFNNQTKIRAIENILQLKEDMDRRSRLLIFDYHRDKMLFEQEMEKFEKEINKRNS